MKCGKVPYFTRKEAKKALKDLNHTNLLDKKLTDVYFCDDCQMWHHTSIQARKSRHLKAKNR